MTKKQLHNPQSKAMNKKNTVASRKLKTDEVSQHDNILCSDGNVTIVSSDEQGKTAHKMLKIKIIEKGGTKIEKTID